LKAWKDANLNSGLMIFIAFSSPHYMGPAEGFEPSRSSLRGMMWTNPRAGTRYVCSSRRIIIDGKKTMRHVCFLLACTALMASAISKESSPYFLTGDAERCAIAKTELDRLCKEYPLPYVLLVRCVPWTTVASCTWGYEPNVRFIEVLPHLDKGSIVRAIRHEYQHLMDDAAGVKSPRTKEELRVADERAEKAERTGKIDDLRKRKR